jgi:hypothetical protein
LIVPPTPSPPRCPSRLARRANSAGGRAVGGRLRRGRCDGGDG